MAFEQSVNKLWDRLKQDIENNVLVPENWNYPEINSIMDELKISYNWRKEIFNNFKYELIYLKKRPTRNLERVDGCHVQLYDTYICKDCGCIIHHRDDVEECFDSLFCPVCNPTDRFSRAYDINDGSEHYKQMYTGCMMAKEFHRKMNHWFWRRWINFKTAKSTYTYKIKHAILHKISAKYRVNYQERLKRLELN